MVYAMLISRHFAALMCLSLRPLKRGNSKIWIFKNFQHLRLTLNESTRLARPLLPGAKNYNQAAADILFSLFNLTGLSEGVSLKIISMIE